MTPLGQGKRVTVTRGSLVQFNIEDLEVRHCRKWAVNGVNESHDKNVNLELSH